MIKHWLIIIISIINPYEPLLTTFDIVYDD